MNYVKTIGVGILLIFNAIAFGNASAKEVPSMTPEVVITTGDQILAAPTSEDYLEDVRRLERLFYEEFTIYGETKVSELKSKIAHRESGGIDDPYKAKNQYGHTGKYQFSARTLKGLGYTREDIAKYMSDPDMQEESMNKLLEHNYEIIKRYGLIKYVGKKLGGVEMTVEGMLAASHLLGPYAVKHFCITGGSMSQPVLTMKNGKTFQVRKYDGNGTSIKSYLLI